MNCPVCSVNLLLSTREGVEIDYCPKCRGVWLDRGEIDKIIEKVTYQQQLPPMPSQPPMRQSGRFELDDDDDDDRRQHLPPHGGQHPSQYPPKKRKGFLGEIFDWD